MGTFFGQYLLAKGLVTEKQLSAALAYQRQANKPLGALAAERGDLNPSQVESVLEAQRERVLLFGELCEECGYLTQPQVGDLLSEQSGRHLLLGEALQYLGLISAEDLMAAVNEYWRLEKELERRNETLLRSETGREYLLRLMECLKAAYRRSAGQEVKLIGVCDDLTAAGVDYGWVTELEIAHIKTVEFSLCLPREVLCELARLRLGDGSDPAERDVAAALHSLGAMVKSYFIDWLRTGGMAAAEGESGAFDADNLDEAVEGQLLLELASPRGPVLLGFRTDALELV